MNRVIWTCWLQGRENAPALVRACLQSWERNNPDWAFRCLDATSIERYVPLEQCVDLKRQSVTAASLSDILRIMLLREFGGVWVDATLFCHRPLDDWLPGVMPTGFFAFAAPSRTRPLSSWFLGAEPNHRLVATWHRRTIAHWSNRASSDDYFWFHHLFRDMCETDPEAAAAWSKVPKVSADGPHALQFAGRMYRPLEDSLTSIDWSTPVFKLTHRLPTEGLKPGCLLDHLLKRDGDVEPASAPPTPIAAAGPAPTSFASLKVSTQNLGDHVQILAGLRLLARLGIAPSRLVDRDHEIRSAPGLGPDDGPVGILLNGWFKSNRVEWPPHPSLSPLMIGFHIRLFKCPELVSDASIDFFRRHQPIGCRDVYTDRLLRSKGVDAFTSNCLSLTFLRRVDDPANQTEVFVVSRDERINSHLPESIGPYTFVSHYSGSVDFANNMARATALLEAYRSRARLIVTTLLHCALPAIAMGIPVVVFYPVNDAPGHASDRERFSSLESMLRVHRLDDVDSVDWQPLPVDAGDIKLRILDRFYAMAARWRPAPAPSIGPIAPPARSAPR